MPPSQANNLFDPLTNQVSHGFSPWDIVMRDSVTTHTSAQADAAANVVAARVRLVTEVPDVNNYRVLTLRGGVEVDLGSNHPLSAQPFGTRIYLSPSTPRGMTATVPTTSPEVVMELGWVIAAQIIMWQPAERLWIPEEYVS